MIFKAFRSQRGSTLLMVLLFMTILSMLGITILSVTLFNYKMKSLDVEMKKDLYSAEAGIEEATAIIETKVFEAIDSANKTVEVNLETGVDKDLYTTYETDDQGYVINEIIDEVKLKNTMEIWFKDGYKEYIKENLVSALEDKDSYIANDEALFKGGITITTSTDKDNDFTAGDIYSIEVTSDFDTEGGRNRKVSKLFTIQVPLYEQPYYAEVFYYNFTSLNIQRFSDNVLTSEGDIQIEDGDVTVQSGHIFAKGGGEEILDKNEGLVVNGGSLQVQKGDIVTKKYVRANGSNIDIDVLGDIFCNTLVVDKNANNANISVGKAEDDKTVKYRVFTEDDLELNGSNSSIEIYGSYYGFADGSSGTSIKTHDESSAIVINSSDIGTSSKLVISGEASDYDYYIDKSGDRHILDNGIIIGGTAYIDFNDNKRYQTGESISLIGNYMAYTPFVIPVVIADVDKDMTIEYLGRYSDSDNYGTYSAPIDESSNLDVELADTYVKSSVTRNLTAKIKGDILTKSKEENAFSVFVGWDSEKETGIKLSNVIYSTGAYITEGNVLNDKYAGLDYETLLNLLEDAYTDKTEDLSINGNYNYPGKKVKLFSESRRELCFLSNSQSDNVALIGGNGTSPSEASYSFQVGDELIKGIIITEGDVYITGDINFEGIIAAAGNIYFEDDYPKVITLNKNVEIKSSVAGVGAEDGLDNYIDLSDIIKSSSWKTDYE